MKQLSNITSPFIAYIEKRDAMISEVDDLNGARFLHLDNGEFNRVFTVEEFSGAWHKDQPVYFGTLTVSEKKSGIVVSSGAFYVEKDLLTDPEFWDRLD